HKLRVVKTIIQLRFLFIPMLIIIIVTKLFKGIPLTWDKDYSLLIAEVIIFIVFTSYFHSISEDSETKVSRNIFSTRYHCVLIVYIIAGIITANYLFSVSLKRANASTKTIDTGPVNVSCHTDRHIINIREDEQNKLTYFAWDKSKRTKNPSLVLSDGTVRTKSKDGCEYLVYSFFKGKY